MTSSHTRIAAGVAAFLFATAAVDIGRAMAQAATPSTTPSTGDVIATTCGAGTKDQCSTKPVESCDWVFDVSFDRDKGFSVKIGQSNCKVTGYVPIYKDNERDAFSLSLACNFLSPFLGLPLGAGCSDE